MPSMAWDVFLWLISFIPWWFWIIAAGGLMGVVRVYLGSWRLAMAIAALAVAAGFQADATKRGWYKGYDKATTVYQKQIDKMVREKKIAPVKLNRIKRPNAPKFSQPADTVIEHITPSPKRNKRDKLRP